MKLSSHLSIISHSLLALSAMTLAAGAHAETKTLYIGMNGGNMERTFTDYVFPAFEKKHDVKIVVVPGGSADILAKAQAAKDKPQMHVMFLDDAVMYRAINMGLCEKMKPNPALNQLVPVARIKGDMAEGVTISMTGLAYNTKIYDENKWPAPTSWLDLADPKLKGKVVFQSIPASTFGLHAFLSLNKIWGGTDTNVEPAFNKWSSTVGPNVIEYISNSSKISEMAQTGEAALFPYTSTQVTILKNKGIPVKYVQPKEGTIVLQVAECVIANNSEPDLSQELAAYLVSAEAQTQALEHGFFNGTNTQIKATSPAAVEQQKEITQAVKNSRALDWDAINKDRPKWNNRWNRQIEQ